MEFRERSAGRQAGRQADRQAGRQVGRQADRQQVGRRRAALSFFTHINTKYRVKLGCG